jgi:hypothetical protein
MFAGQPQQALQQRRTIVCQKKNGHLPIFLIVQATFDRFSIVATMLLQVAHDMLLVMRRPSLTIELYGIAECAAMGNTAVRQ